MSKERSLIFSLFAIGLAGNLAAVLSTCFILMDFPVSFIAVGIVLYAMWIIGSNSMRIQRKFYMSETVRLDDLTQYSSSMNAWSSIHRLASGIYPGSADNIDKGESTISLLGPRKKSLNEIV